MQAEPMTNRDLLRDPVPREGPTHDCVRHVIAILDCEDSARDFVQRAKRGGLSVEGSSVMFTGDMFTNLQLQHDAQMYVAGMDRGLKIAGEIVNSTEVPHCPQPVAADRPGK